MEHHTSPLAADLLIHARWIIPVEPDNTVLEHHSIAVTNGIITDILPQDIARKRHAGARQTVELSKHALIPGLINLHAHAGMTLMRGIADDLPLMQWLQERIWPLEAQHLCATFVRDGTALAATEMLMGGITTCNDMYFFGDAAAEIFVQMGMRAVIGTPVLEFPTPFAANADEHLQKALATLARWRAHPLIRFALAPHAPYTVSDATFRRITTLAAELELPIHTHLHETRQEIDDSLAQHGVRPLTRLARLGVLGHGTICAHAIHLDEADIDLLVHHGCSIAHCPSSNMKLASGIAPVTRLLDAGLRVGLGTDSAASNNRLDLFTEMRQAALLAKTATQDATVVPAHVALRMATLDGASALGMETSIGSIKTGKHADLCAVSFEQIGMLPHFNPISHLVYAAGRENVTHVWCAGQARLADKQLMLQNSDSKLIRPTAIWQTKLTL